MDLLPRHPNGWYVVAFSSDLRAADVLNLRFMDQEVVLFRTESGQACLMDAYCPHLGAHMGHGGSVHGECIQCPFHHFEFDVTGRCTSIPYGTRIPPKALARVFPVAEQHGLILAFHDADGNAPEWQVPALDTQGWLPLKSEQWTFRGHPQETTENSVDIAHFSEVHGYTHVAILADLTTDGPYLTNRYTMTRERALLGKSVRTEFTIHVYGLGYSLVDVQVSDLGLRSRLFVLATPTEGEHICLRIAISLHEDTRPTKVHPLLALAPRGLINNIMASEALKGFAHDVLQDIPIWQHKRYVQPPILAEGDGPVGAYRQWAKQFYTLSDRGKI
jgi:nitrite reductase/ring-hydroxylating ferredoxin subunit